MSGCASFERWLDEGRPGEAAAPMGAHAGSCAACAALLAADDALEAALAAPAVRAPAGFSERVMRRVATDERLRRAPVVRDDIPFWMRVASEPAAAGACVILGLLVWQMRAFLAAAHAMLGGASALLRGLEPALPAVPVGSVTPEVAFALALALLPPAVLAGVAGYRWALGATARAAGAKLHPLLRQR